ncbi:antirestriction phage head protein DarA, partial [Atlantibacter hermannii]|uniref:antirestriction phage head protein DarA n=1 Tax=Atlantibacter hermannii TaxID=565 RepID=UPI0028AE295B
MIDLTKGIELTDKPNFVAQPIADAIYAELMTGSSADMMLESVTIDDVDHAYLGDEMLYVSIATGTAMFEAVTSERLRLSQTMRAFVRSLNRGMNGTGIKAGTDDAGIDEEGRKTVGGAIIGKVRRVNNIPIMTALIPLSDGQSISLIFHSPTSDNGSIKNSDLLVAFRFLLNKRDVTHIVAPIGGRDVSLQQVSQALANLAERNGAKFAKQQSAQMKLRADIEGLNAEVDQLSEQQSTQNDTQQLRDKLATQRQINADLEAQLAALKTNAGSDVITLPGETGRTFSDTTRKVKEGLSMSGSVTLSNGAEVAYKTADDNGDLVGWVQITDPSGQVYKMPSPSSQGAKMGETATKLLKAYRENKADKFAVAAPAEPTPPPAEPVPESEGNQSTGKYRYALVNRPAGPATIPEGNTAILPPVSQSEPYGRIARHGFVTYDAPLSDADMTAFELKLIPTHADLDALATMIA